MTKAGSDHLKAQARRIAQTSGRRYPDVRAEQRRPSHPAPAPAPSKELVLLCGGLAHPLGGGRCAREAGHRRLDGNWSWCSPEPHLPAHIWMGYQRAADDDYIAKENARRAALTPEERAAEEEATYYADMADAGSEYDPREDKYTELADELRDEEEESDEDDFLYGDDVYDGEDEYEVTF